MAKRTTPSRQQAPRPGEPAAGPRTKRPRTAAADRFDPASVSLAEAAEPHATEIGPESVRDRIARRAYEIYTERGGQHGLDLDDWLRAEQEITGNRGDVEG